MPAPVPRSLVVILRTMLILAATGSLVVLAVILPLLWIDLGGVSVAYAAPLIAALALGVACLQVVGVCIWRLLTLVLRGRIFSRSAFRYVDVITGAVAAGGVLLVILGVVLSEGTAAPGLVLLIGGAALLAFAAALTVNVARRLLAQAVERDTQARRLEDELSDVI
ncbi:DUF2975 domain-containing protein [Citricoccus sp.]|uniref:DUF2975 domain-containing protein n=1 Tax=Citricoccus sp. TaxID=1978372 RepID=UPI0028BE6618|nr:DUF2975 domain-containing protein [Citricoccus sp.]